MGLMRHPVVVFAISWTALLVLARLRRGVAPAHISGRPNLLLGASVAALATYCAILGWYTFSPSYFDAAEPTITSVAAVFRAGLPLYPALDAAERYAHIYGPLLFLAHATAFALAGASIFVSKAVGSLAALLSLGIAFTVYRRRAGAAVACHVAAASGLVYLYFGNAAFWTRSDPLLILCASIGLAAAVARPSGIATIALGLATGAAINLKVTGAIYLVPVYAMAWSTHGRRVVASAVGIAGVTAILPFLLPAVSLVHYVGYLQLSARNGLLTSRLLENAEWGLFLLAPPLAAWAAVGGTQRQREVGRLFAAVVGSIAVIAIVSAKPGGGAFHLLPFVPILGYLITAVPREDWNRSAVPRVAAAFTVTACAIAVPRQAVFIGTVANRHLDLAIADARRFAEDKATKRVAIGYAGTSHLSHARPVLVFRSGDYLIDGPAVQEHRLSGLDIPAATIEAIDRCRFDYWLLPQNAPPFDVPSAYRPLGPADVFSERFRSAFTQRYVRIGRTAFYDVWECRAQASGASR
jgi:hypothetical protein